MDLTPNALQKMKTNETKNPILKVLGVKRSNSLPLRFAALVWDGTNREIAFFSECLNHLFLENKIKCDTRISATHFQYRTKTSKEPFSLTQGTKHLFIFQLVILDQGKYNTKQVQPNENQNKQKIKIEENQQEQGQQYFQNNYQPQEQNQFYYQPQFQQPLQQQEPLQQQQQYYQNNYQPQQQNQIYQQPQQQQSSFQSQNAYRNENQGEKNKISFPPNSQMGSRLESVDVQARVTYKTKIKRFKGERNFRLFSAYLIDSDNTEIKITFFDEQADKYYDLLKREKTYFITNASVVSSKKAFSLLQNDYELKGYSSQMKIEPIAGDNIPYHNLIFTPLDQITKKEFSELNYFDVIGIVTNVGKIQAVKTKSYTTIKRNIQIKDQSGSSIQFVIWGERCVKFKIKPQATNVVVLRNAILRKYKSWTYLGIQSMTQIIINPNYNIATILKKWWDDSVNGNKDKKSKQQQALTVKVAFKGEIRKFSINANSNYKSFQAILYNIANKNGKCFKLQYRDQEDDLITVTNELEFQEVRCFAKSINPKILKFKLVESNQVETSTQQQNGKQSESFDGARTLTQKDDEKTKRRRTNFPKSSTKFNQSILDDNIEEGGMGMEMEMEMEMKTEENDNENENEDENEKGNEKEKENEKENENEKGNENQNEKENQNKSEINKKQSFGFTSGFINQIKMSPEKLDLARRVQNFNKNEKMEEEEEIDQLNQQILQLQKQKQEKINELQQKRKNGGGKYKNNFRKRKIIEEVNSKK
ncbi:replication protein a 70 kda DNA-binding subunit a [Anaeramoeba flamelloides]|uniref:Replication protein a 70 kDa DNA-binding subunit a n=1 Tax=Anaeramoeba flamelloides TaxID=1746091 RepID=A0ABQ8X934_9EUKA|nr:replication protein a 70 kda DNA-binding subunit a [Anaeramoeba flamelloides]